MTKPLEQCAYAKLGMQDEVCNEIRCDGFSEDCFHYTTEEHLNKFRGMFRLRNPEHPQIRKFYRRYPEWK